MRKHAVRARRHGGKRPHLHRGTVLQKLQVQQTHLRGQQGDATDGEPLQHRAKLRTVRECGHRVRSHVASRGQHQMSQSSVRREEERRHLHEVRSSQHLVRLLLRELQALLEKRTIRPGKKLKNRIKKKWQ